MDALPLQLFLKPIQARSLLPPDAVSVVFGNIEHILALNRELLSYIQQKGPVDAFINMGPFLKVYATYADNYQNALEIVQVSVVLCRCEVRLHRAWLLALKCNTILVGNGCSGALTHAHVVGSSVLQCCTH